MRGVISATATAVLAWFAATLGAALVADAVPQAVAQVLPFAETDPALRGAFVAFVVGAGVLVVIVYALALISALLGTRKAAES